VADKAVRILAKAMYDVVEGDADRKEEIGRTMQEDFNELDLRPHFNELSSTEKAACSDRAEDLAHQDQSSAQVSHPSSDQPRRPEQAVRKASKPTTGMTWGE